MKKTLLILPFLLIACTTTQVKTQIKGKVYDQPKLHNADCFIDKQTFQEANVLLLEETDTTYKVRAGDGKVLGLPINQCILSQIPKDVPTTGKLRWVKCKLGPMSLVTDSLVYLDDEKHFYRLQRVIDGQVWMLPREHCSIFSHPEQ